MGGCCGRIGHMTLSLSDDVADSLCVGRVCFFLFSAGFSDPSFFIRCPHFHSSSGWRRLDARPLGQDEPTVIMMDMDGVVALVLRGCNACDTGTAKGQRARNDHGRRAHRRWSRGSRRSRHADCDRPPRTTPPNARGALFAFPVPTPGISPATVALQLGAPRFEKMPAGRRR